MIVLARLARFELEVAHPLRRVLDPIDAHSKAAYRT